MVVKWEQNNSNNFSSLIFVSHFTNSGHVIAVSSLWKSFSLKPIYNNNYLLLWNIKGRCNLNECILSATSTMEYFIGTYITLIIIFKTQTI